MNFIFSSNEFFVLLNIFKWTSESSSGCVITSVSIGKHQPWHIRWHHLMPHAITYNCKVNSQNIAFKVLPNILSECKFNIRLSTQKDIFPKLKEFEVVFFAFDSSLLIAVHSENVYMEVSTFLALMLTRLASDNCGSKSPEFICHSNWKISDWMSRKVLI